jgi:hypothetical protein
VQRRRHVAFVFPKLRRTLPASGTGEEILPWTFQQREMSTEPDFELPDSTGVSRRLSALVASGPVVLVFYRGRW